MNYVESMGLMNLYRTKNIGFIVAETNFQFKSDLNFPGNISIDAKNVFVKNTSFSLEHTIMDDNGELVAITKDVLVAFDFTKKRKVFNT